jgi:hypothetical protein
MRESIHRVESESLRSIRISHRSFCSRLRLFYNHIMFVCTTDNTQSTLEYVNGLNWIFLSKFFFFCFILPRRRRRRRRTIDLSVNALLTSIATIDGQFKSHVYSALDSFLSSIVPNKTSSTKHVLLVSIRPNDDRAHQDSVTVKP